MSDDLLADMRAIKDSIRKPELDGLVSAIHSGVIVMPSEKVTRTTILVTPDLYRDLQKRITSDTEKDKADEQ